MRGSSQTLIFRRTTDRPSQQGFDDGVPEAYARGAYDELLHGDLANDGWQAYWRARSQMAIDEFRALPLLEQAYRLFDTERDALGRGLCARTAFVALNYGESTFAGVRGWTDRSANTELTATEVVALEPSTRAWWLTGQLARVYADNATEYHAHATVSACKALLELLLDVQAPLDDDARLIAAMALFEYAEFEDDEALFDRVLSSVEVLLKDRRGSALYRGRLWHRIFRCGFMIGPARQRAEPRIDVAKAEAEALAIAERHCLPHLEATVLAVRAFYANVSRDCGLADAAIQRLGRITDFGRPLAAAWYYLLRAQVCARSEELTPALMFFRQATEAARRSEAPPPGQQTYLIAYASMLSQLGHWDEAEAIYANLIVWQSGRDLEITQCRRLLVAAQRAAVQQPERFSALRSALLARARELRYVSFSLATPRTTADFLAEALRAGEPADFIAEVVRTRKLPAREGYPSHWPWPVRIEAMGGLHISIEGRPLIMSPRPQKKPIDLLKLLVAQGPSPVSSAIAMDALWPEADGDNAKGSFDMALMRLRKLLGRDELVRMEGGRVGLDREQVWVDAWAFATDAEVPYMGTLFGDAPSEPWSSVPRQRLLECYLRRSHDRAQRLEAKQHHAEALALYEAALQHDPLAEPMTRGAMRCCIAMGEPVQAIRAFERCRERLATALGVTPALATQRLADSLRRR